MAATQGILIAVEGIDGAGKTTQVRLLGDRLAAAGLPVVTSKEPTDGPWGQKIRQSAENGRLPLEQEIEAFVNDRKEHIANVIGPALAERKVVILDRYFYSNIAYQGARGADVAELAEQMREFAPPPDVVFLLDLDPVVALARIKNGRKDKPNKFERVDALRRVRAIFNQLAAQDSRIRTLDGTLPINFLSDQIIGILVDGVLKDRYCAKAYGCDIFYCSAREAGECRWFLIQEKLHSHAPIKSAKLQ